jgi:hypothetical protein
MNVKITEYEAGSAFKRWLLPGYGVTKISVQVTLLDGETEVGSIVGRRTV